MKHWLSSQPPPWTSNLQLRLAPYFPKINANRRQIALSFLANNRLDSGSELFPFVARALTNSNSTERLIAAAAMARIARTTNNIDADAALRALLPLSYELNDSSPVIAATGVRLYNLNYEIDRAIEEIDPQRIFHPLLVLELGPLPNRVGAARELAELPRMPERAVPLLIANLSSTNRSVQEACAIALAKYEAQALPALPTLSNLLSHPRPRIRAAASNALSVINAKETNAHR